MNLNFPKKELKECLYYENLDNDLIKCVLCPNKCIIDKNKTGICKTRININGKLKSLNYEKYTSVALDKIEKKPLYHFYPGKKTLSVGSFGCNMKCLHCQNYQISNSEFSTYNIIEMDSGTIINLTKDKNSDIISYTYNEPTVFYESVLSTSKIAKESNLKNVLITNGFICKEPLKNLIEYIDAMNIDLKSYSDEFYKRVCSTTLLPVLDTIKLSYENNIHIELTYLIIPDVNDSETEIKNACNWIINNIGNEIPLHFTRFFPMYRLQNKKETSIEKLYEAKKIAKNIGIKYCYLGNIETDNDTFCPNCGKKIIERTKFEEKIISGKIINNKLICECGKDIYGKF